MLVMSAGKVPRGGWPGRVTELHLRAVSQEWARLIEGSVSGSNASTLASIANELEAREERERELLPFLSLHRSIDVLQPAGRSCREPAGDGGEIPR